MKSPETKQKNITFKALTMLILLTGIIYSAIYLYELDLSFHDYIPDIISIAEDLNMSNLVSVIYLGPRFFDTLLEVVVVLLTVYGIQYVHSKNNHPHPV